MARYSDTSVYALLTAILADDMILFYKDSDASEHLIKFSDFVKSVESLITRRFLTNIIYGNITLDDTYEFVVTNSGSPLTVTLPEASSYPGKLYIISNKGTAVVTVQVTPGDQIDAGTNIDLDQWEEATLISDGVDTWHLVASYVVSSYISP